MATKRTQCNKCGSFKILEKNPQSRKLSKSILCSITCQCQDCENIFNIQSWTEAGRRKGIKY